MNLQLKTLVTTALLTLSIASSSLAQSYNPKAEVPLDEKIKHGTLANGMKYYIRANKLPEQRAEFYIVHNVGAILENDDQNGLAHFTEHMAFNGTQNFPKKGLLNYLETIGCKFGQNVNAFTAMDVTSYNISSVPVTREGIIDSALLILHDWSNYISFDADEIESERGVIREEWRTRGGAQARLSDKLRPIMYKGSKYGERNVIGDTAVINNFKHETIKAFYHQWYRPDLQAVIIVGDINVDEMEAKVKKVFGDIPAVNNPTPKPTYELPDNNDPLIAVATDKEATNSVVRLLFKHNTIEKAEKNQEYLRLSIARGLINSMMNERIGELLQKENSPCTQAYTGYNEFTETKDAFSAAALAKKDMTIPALELIYTESRRMQLHGFKQTELDRAKANLLRSIQSQYLDREKQKHQSYVWEIFEKFTSNEPACSIEYYQQFAQEVTGGIVLDEINTIAREYITDKNVIITLTAPEKEEIVVPDSTALLAAFNKVKNANIAPYEEKTIASSLMNEMPTPGKIIKEKKNKELDATEWTLSNGINVVLKTTKHKEDQVMLKGVSTGGRSQVGENDYLTSRLMNDIVSEMGLGEFSKTDLQKIMSGKRASTRMGLYDEQEMISGNASPADIEMMLQQINLRFTHPRFDEEAFNALMEKVKTMYENKALNPSSAFYDTINVTLANNHIRQQPITAEKLSEVTFEQVKKIYSERFADPASFTFIFVGNIEAEQLKPLIAIYLGSLPSTNNKEKYIDRGQRTPKGTVKKQFDKPMETAKTSVFACYPGTINYRPSDFVMLSAIKNILDIRYVESIREKEGGSYGVRVNVNNQKNPVKEAYIMLSFDTDPQKASKMVEILHSEIKSLKENGPLEQDVQKTKEFFIKSFADQQKENGYWMGVLNDHYVEKMDNASKYIEMVNKLDSKSIQDFANKTFKTENMIEVMMMPLVSKN